MLEIIGIIGAIGFATCAIPQAWQTIRDGHARGLSHGFLLLWAVGEIFTIVYIWPKQDWILLGNYFFNSLCLLVMMRYKYMPRGKQ